MLTFEHVRKNYDSKRVLEDCSISFEPGKVYALVGPNGTGKSTLMKAADGKNQWWHTHLQGAANRNREQETHCLYVHRTILL